MSRQFPDWLEGFVEYSDDFPSSSLFRKWAGMSAVAACLQRRVFTRIVGRKQFANLYILLVATPGVGKSVAIRAARELCRAHSGTIYITPARITPQALYMELEDAQQSRINITAGTATIHHSLNAMIDEFGIFIRRNDVDFMADMADLYDCPDPFEYKTKTAGEQSASNSWFNFIAGVTPRTVKETFSDDALEMGFPARTILVFCEEAVVHDELFVEDGTDLFDDSNPMFQKLVLDMGEMLTLDGEFYWTPEAKDFLRSWYKRKLKPVPTETKLEHYCVRRLTHFTKLAMIHSASRSNDLEVTIRDVQTAKTSLLEVESIMHLAVAGLGSNQYYVKQQEAVAWLYRQWGESRHPVQEFALVRKLERDIPTIFISQIIEGMLAAKRIITSGIIAAPGQRSFIPDAESQVKILDRTKAKGGKNKDRA